MPFFSVLLSAYATPLLLPLPYTPFPRGYVSPVSSTGSCTEPARATLSLGWCRTALENTCGYLVPVL